MAEVGPKESQEKIPHALSSTTGPVSIKEKPLSPEADLGKKILQAWQSEDPYTALMDKMVAGEMPADLYRPLEQVFTRLDGIFNFAERAAELMKIGQEGILPADLYEALLHALVGDERQSFKILAGFAGRQYAQLEEKHKGKIPREELEELKEKVLIGFVAEAEKLKKEYLDQGKEIPEEKLEPLRASVDSLNKTLKGFIRSELGSIALEKAEGRKDTAKLDKTDITAVVSILFREEQAERLEDAAALYQFLRERKKETGQRVAVFSFGYAGDKPLFNITTMKDLAVGTRGWLRDNPPLPKQEAKKIKDHLRRLETFLLRAGHEEVKQQIKHLRERDTEAEGEKKERRFVLDIEKELSESLGGKAAQERMLGLTVEQRIDTETKLQHALRELVAMNPLGAERVLKEVLFLNNLRSKLLDEGLRMVAEDPTLKTAATEKIFVPSGEEHKYTAASFEKMLGEKKLELAQKMQSAERKGDLKEKEAFGKEVGLIDTVNQEKNIITRLQMALVSGFISAEYYNAFTTIIEATATLTELKAKNYEAEAANLQDVDEAGLTEKQKKIRGERIRKALQNARELHELANKYREGEATYE